MSLSCAFYFILFFLSPTEEEEKMSKPFSSLPSPKEEACDHLPGAQGVLSSHPPFSFRPVCNGQEGAVQPMMPRPPPLSRVVEDEEEEEKNKKHSEPIDLRRGNPVSVAEQKEETGDGVRPLPTERHTTQTRDSTDLGIRPTHVTNSTGEGLDSHLWKLPQKNLNGGDFSAAPLASTSSASALLPPPLSSTPSSQTFFSSLGVTRCPCPSSYIASVQEGQEQERELRHVFSTLHAAPPPPLFSFHATHARPASSLSSVSSPSSSVLQGGGLGDRKKSSISSSSTPRLCDASSSSSLGLSPLFSATLPPPPSADTLRPSRGSAARGKGGHQQTLPATSSGSTSSAHASLYRFPFSFRLRGRLVEQVRGRPSPPPPPLLPHTSVRAQRPPRCARVYSTAVRSMGQASTPLSSSSSPVASSPPTSIQRAEETEEGTQHDDKEKQGHVWSMEELIREATTSHEKVDSSPCTTTTTVETGMVSTMPESFPPSGAPMTLEGEKTATTPVGATQAEQQQRTVATPPPTPILRAASPRDAGGGGPRHEHRHRPPPVRRVILFPPIPPPPAPPFTLEEESGSPATTTTRTSVSPSSLRLLGSRPPLARPSSGASRTSLAPSSSGSPSPSSSRGSLAYQPPPRWWLPRRTSLAHASFRGTSFLGRPSSPFAGGGATEPNTRDEEKKKGQVGVGPSIRPSPLVRPPVCASASSTLSGGSPLLPVSPPLPTTTTTGYVSHPTSPPPLHSPHHFAVVGPVAPSGATAKGFPSSAVPGSLVSPSRGPPPTTTTSASSFSRISSPSHTSSSTVAENARILKEKFTSDSSRRPPLPYSPPTTTTKTVPPSRLGVSPAPLCSSFFLSTSPTTPSSLYPSSSLSPSFPLPPVKKEERCLVGESHPKHPETTEKRPMKETAKNKDNDNDEKQCGPSLHILHCVPLLLHPSSLRMSERMATAVPTCHCRQYCYYQLSSIGPPMDIAPYSLASSPFSPPSLPSTVSSPFSSQNREAFVQKTAEEEEEATPFRTYKERSTTLPPRSVEIPACIGVAFSHSMEDAIELTTSTTLQAVLPEGAPKEEVSFCAPPGEPPTHPPPPPRPGSRPSSSRSPPLMGSRSRSPTPGTRQPSRRDEEVEHTGTVSSSSSPPSPLFSKLASPPLRGFDEEEEVACRAARLHESCGTLVLEEIPQGQEHHHHHAEALYTKDVKGDKDHDVVDPEKRKETNRGGVAQRGVETPDLRGCVTAAPLQEKREKWFTTSTISFPFLTIPCHRPQSPVEDTTSKSREALPLWRTPDPLRLQEGEGSGNEEMSTTTTRAIVRSTNRGGDGGLTGVAPMGEEMEKQDEGHTSDDDDGGRRSASSDFPSFSASSSASSYGKSRRKHRQVQHPLHLLLTSPPLSHEIEAGQESTVLLLPTSPVKRGSSSVTFLLDFPSESRRWCASFGAFPPPPPSSPVLLEEVEHMGNKETAGEGGWGGSSTGAYTKRETKVWISRGGGWSTSFTASPIRRGTGKMESEQGEEVEEGGAAGEAMVSFPTQSTAAALSFYDSLPPSLTPYYTIPITSALGSHTGGIPASFAVLPSSSVPSLSTSSSSPFTALSPIRFPLPVPPPPPPSSSCSSSSCGSSAPVPARAKGRTSSPCPSYSSLLNVMETMGEENEKKREDEEGRRRKGGMCSKGKKRFKEEEESEKGEGKEERVAARSSGRGEGRKESSISSRSSTEVGNFFDSLHRYMRSTPTPRVRLAVRKPFALHVEIEDSDEGDDDAPDNEDGAREEEGGEEAHRARKRKPSHKKSKERKSPPPAGGGGRRGSTSGVGINRISPRNFGPRHSPFQKLSSETAKEEDTEGLDKEEEAGRLVSSLWHDPRPRLTPHIDSLTSSTHPWLWFKNRSPATLSPTNMEKHVVSYFNSSRGGRGSTSGREGSDGHWYSSRSSLSWYPLKSIFRPHSTEISEEDEDEEVEEEEEEGKDDEDAASKRTPNSLVKGDLSSPSSPGQPRASAGSGIRMEQGKEREEEKQTATPSHFSIQNRRKRQRKKKQNLCGKSRGSSMSGSHLHQRSPPRGRGIAANRKSEGLVMLRTPLSFPEGSPFPQFLAPSEGVVLLGPAALSGRGGGGGGSSVGGLLSPSSSHIGIPSSMVLATTPFGVPLSITTPSFPLMFPWSITSSTLPDGDGEGPSAPPPPPPPPPHEEGEEKPLAPTRIGVPLPPSGLPSGAKECEVGPAPSSHLQGASISESMTSNTSSGRIGSRALWKRNRPSARSSMSHKRPVQYSSSGSSSTALIPSFAQLPLEDEECIMALPLSPSLSFRTDYGSFTPCSSTKKKKKI